MDKRLLSIAESYLKVLCIDIGERPVGSKANIKATRYFEQKLKEFSWQTASDRFDAMDWTEEGAEIVSDNFKLSAFPSPYSPGCNVSANLVTVSSLDELKNSDAGGKILLLYGDIAKEQLMPKNFVFYNPDEHKQIYKLLESKAPAAIITATGRCSATAGGVYPFPMIEDGDFDIPSVYLTEEEGLKLLTLKGKKVHLISNAERKKSEGYNITGRKGGGEKKIVVTAHIDARKGTPGAIDNATGVIVLLLLAEIFKDWDHGSIELAALNGEDYYAVPGQMKYIQLNNNNFESIKLNINIDGAGMKDSSIHISFYGMEEGKKKLVDEIVSNVSAIKEGEQWPQGDHSIFVQFGCPAIVFSSTWLIEHMTNHDITHTPKDNPSIVDCSKMVTIAETISTIIRKL